MPKAFETQKCQAYASILLFVIYVAVSIRASEIQISRFMFLLSSTADLTELG